jgi:cytidine deaminase
MEPLRSELRVIEVAETLARTLGDDPNHTVAAAALDAQGRIFTSVNVHHFTGGPCAELAVLGAVAAAGSGPLVAIAAAGDRSRGLIVPCGRCRQVLLDLHPDVLVAVLTEEGPRMRPIAKLLPDTYFFPDARAERSSGLIRATSRRSRAGLRHRPSLGMSACPQVKPFFILKTMNALPCGERFWPCVSTTSMT